jgi:hypothetical protein
MKPACNRFVAAHQSRRGVNLAAQISHTRLALWSYPAVGRAVLARASCQADEQVYLGEREIFVH